MDLLPDDTIYAVLCRLELYDVLNFSRVARRYKALGNSDDVWRRLCTVSGYKLSPDQDTAHQSWKSVFRERYLKTKKEWILAHRARVLSLRSQLQEHDLLTHKRKRSLHAELLKGAHLKSCLQEVRRRRQTDSSVRCWQPALVRQHHLEVLSNSQVQGQWAERDLEQHLRDNQLVVTSLKKSLQGSDKRRRCLNDRIQALEGL